MKALPRVAPHHLLALPLLSLSVACSGADAEWGDAEEPDPPTDNSVDGSADDSSSETFELVDKALHPPKVGCTGTQVTYVNAVATRALELADDAYHHLTTSNEDDNRYEKWFGEFLQERWLDVVERAAGIYFLMPSVTAHCPNPNEDFRCRGNQAIAPSPGRDVFLCDPFFKDLLSLSGLAYQRELDRLAAVYYHEVSHLDFTFFEGGTDDVRSARSLGLAEILAKQDPNRAIVNSYNWEGFALNPR